MKVYHVFHSYEVDCGDGCGYPEVKSDLIATFENKEDADAFVEKLGVPFRPNACLQCGELNVETEDVIAHRDFNLDDYDPKNYWWRPESDKFEDYWYGESDEDDE